MWEAHIQLGLVTGFYTQDLAILSQALCFYQLSQVVSPQQMEVSALLFFPWTLTPCNRALRHLEWLEFRIYLSSSPSWQEVMIWIGTHVFPTISQINRRYRLSCPPSISVNLFNCSLTYPYRWMVIQWVASALSGTKIHTQEVFWYSYQSA